MKKNTSKLSYIKVEMTDNSFEISQLGKRGSFKTEIDLNLILLGLGKANNGKRQNKCSIKFQNFKSEKKLNDTMAQLLAR